MHQIGEYVCYGQSGICRIGEIREMDFTGEKKEYYVLLPLYRSDSSLYVPCDNPELTGKMLPPLTPDQIRETVARVKEMPASWVRDFRQRSEASKKALSSGDRVEVLFLMKNIHCHKKDAAGEGKRIHTTDDYFLKDAENLICHEFAFVLNQEVSAVLSELKKELELN